MSIDTPAEAKTIPAPTSRRLGNLALVWDHVRRYPGQIAAALGALSITSLATIAHSITC